MYVASDLAAIARNNDLLNVAGLHAAVGTPLTDEQLKSFTTLKSTDGVYYNKALNTLAITKSGVTFDGYDFRGVSINVQADNVTIKNSTFDASVGKYAINAFPGTKNLTVVRSTFDGLKLDNIGYVDFVASRGENTALTNNAFLDAPSDAVTIQSGTISGNYFAGGSYATGAHADAIWIGKTIGSVVITDNVIDWRSRADAPNENNEAVRITGELGNVSDVLVKNNILLGGSMTVLVSDGATQTHNADQVGTVTGVKIVENVIDFGKYGDLEQTSRPKDMVYADNMHASGGPLTPGPEAIGLLPDLSTLNGISAASATASIIGTAKGDYIQGGSGSNYIHAGAGDDVIVGGGGRDFITGGSGKDIFVYTSLTNDGTDRIADFTQGEDRINLATITGAPNAPNDWQWLGSESFTGHTWQLRYGFTSGVTTIEVDANGDLKADFKLELTGQIPLQTSDFILAGGELTRPPESGPGIPPPPPLSHPSVSPTPVDVPKASAPSQLAGPVPPAQSASPTLVLQASASGNHVIEQASAHAILSGTEADGPRIGTVSDILMGQGGKDILYVGAGQDTFRFEKLSGSLSTGSGNDAIGDFVRGEDTIDLHAIDANALTATNDAFTWIGSDAFTKNAGELRMASIAGGHQVQADINGDGKTDFAINVMTKMAFQASDFVL
ncbi:M10 family metallopeptidase C-terminal domain-containing protein [Methylorubrum sp. POS3]|uniref:M10 family metallopeptidase C-terminal domain-containing protein n=1 Tax=Methylorubrum sp. POS3 TaxID=2998492 RepID=UPI0037273330